jgi:hypothetical protein
MRDTEQAMIGRICVNTVDDRERELPFRQVFTIALIETTLHQQHYVSIT